jgi:hypothetical protein
VTKQRPVVNDCVTWVWGASSYKTSPRPVDSLFTVTIRRGLGSGVRPETSAGAIGGGSEQDVNRRVSGNIIGPNIHLSPYDRAEILDGLRLCNRTEGELIILIPTQQICGNISMHLVISLNDKSLRSTVI